MKTKFEIIPADKEKIKTTYTTYANDISAMHGVDVENLLLEGIQYEIQQQIDKEIIKSIMNK